MSHPVFTGVSWKNDAQPHIQWRHIDGPLLSMRTGEVHWLTLWERIQFRFGWTDIWKLESKHSELLRRFRSQSNTGGVE
jgi:hypothetical protein